MDNVEYVLPVNGLRCMSCVARLEKVLHQHPDVATAQVDLMAKQMHLQLDNAEALSGLQPKSWLQRLRPWPASQQLCSQQPFIPKPFRA
jgi:cation transport ATPase